ncbi:hypothetical protein HSX11_14875 [Oxalobacteraceae bacterium]|nr:hypothetical protein [Oxalobacteraceae bacterium]
MTIKFEVLGAPGAAPMPAGRHHAEARQDRWMFELEHALLAQGSKKNDTPQEQRSAEAAPQQDLADPAAAASKGGLKSGAAHQGGAAAQASAQQSATAQAGRTAARDDAGAAGDQVQAQAQAVAAAPALAAAQSQWSAAAFAVAPAVSQETALGAYAQAGATLAARRAGPAVAEANSGVQTLARMNKAEAAPVQLGLGQAEAQAEPAPGAPEQAEAQEVLAHGGATPDSEAYADKLMHVYRGEEGVQAWIRDAALGANQTERLVQALGEELAGAGTRLAALTVNGRKLTLPAQPGGAQQTQDAQDEFMQHAAAAPASAAAATIQRRGAV